MIILIFNTIYTYTIVISNANTYLKSRLIPRNIGRAYLTYPSRFIQFDFVPNRGGVQFSNPRNGLWTYLFKYVLRTLAGPPL